MKSLADIDASKAPKHVIIYGAPKTGKTLQALKLAEVGYEIVLIEIENGHLVGKQLTPEGQARIRVVLIPDTPANPCAMNALLTLFKSGQVEVCEEHGHVKCRICVGKMIPLDKLVLSEANPKTIYVLDSLTQLTSSILNWMTLREPDPEWNPEFKDWRKMGNVLDVVLGGIQNSPYNWIVISHETSTQLHEGKTDKAEKLVPVAGTRNFSRNAAKYFDTVVYCEVLNGSHTFQSKTTYKNNILTGDRMNVDISAVEDKTLGLLPIFLGDTSKNKPTGTSAALSLLGKK